VSDRAGLISAILDDLADDTPRLVFADYLQENGEVERAEFIRLQCEVATLPPKIRTKSPVHKRAGALLKKHGPAWSRALGLPDHRTYDRGFLARVPVDSGRFAEQTAAILPHEPATFSLRLWWWTDENQTPITPKWVDALAANPHLKAVTDISSQGGGWGKYFPRLMKSPHLSNLKGINFFEDVIGLAGVKAIVDSPSPFVLDDLDLNESLQSQDDAETANTVKAVKLIATSPRFASLRHLGLMFNSLEDASAEALLDSTTLPRSLHLELQENPCEGDYLEQLEERFGGVFNQGEDED
jgi:uncharacterized protein (TIGR02996 family)